MPDNRRMLKAVVFSLWTAAAVCFVIATVKNGLNWQFEGEAETWAFAAFGLVLSSFAIAVLVSWLQG